MIFTNEALRQHITNGYDQVTPQQCCELLASGDAGEPRITRLNEVDCLMIGITRYDVQCTAFAVYTHDLHDQFF